MTRYMLRRWYMRGDVDQREVMIVDNLADAKRIAREDFRAGCNTTWARTEGCTLNARCRSCKYCEVEHRRSALRHTLVSCRLDSTAGELRDEDVPEQELMCPGYLPDTREREFAEWVEAEEIGWL